MKITDIRTLSLSRTHEPKRQWYSATFHVPKADCSICIIETDEGLQGIAEPCAYGVPPAIAARIAELKPSSHRPRPPRRGPDAAQRSRARQ